MPTYTFKAPDGRTIRLKGDSPPTEDELEDVFASLPPRTKSAAEAPTQAPPAQEEKTLANAPGRYIEGAWKHLNPVEMIKGAANAVMHPLDTIAAAQQQNEDQLRQALDVNYEVQSPEFREKLRQMGPLEGTAAVLKPMFEMGTRGLASAVPLVGPPVADALNRIVQEGDIAGGMGEIAGIAAAPKVAKAVAAPVRAVVRGAARVAGPAGREAAAAALESKAAARIEDLAPKVGANKTRFANNLKDAAPQLVRDLADDGAPLTKGGFHEQIKAKLSEAEAALDEAADARLPTKTFSVKEVLSGLKEARARLTSKAVGRGEDVVPAPNSARVAQIDQAINEVQRLKGPFVTYEAMRRLRQAWDQPAKVVYNPSLTADFLKQKGGALGAADVTSVLRDQLAKWDPQTAAANAKYALYRSVDDALKAAAETERARPKVGRQIMARVTGALAGGASGGTAGALAGVAGAPIIDSVMASGVTTQFKTAAMLQKLASAIRRGDAGKVHGVLHDLKKAGLLAGGAVERPAAAVPARPKAAENEKDEPRDRVAMR